jgi:hypothetical protein
MCRYAHLVTVKSLIFMDLVYGMNSYEKAVWCPPPAYHFNLDKFQHVSIRLLPQPTP